MNTTNVVESTGLIKIGGNKTINNRRFSDYLCTCCNKVCTKRIDYALKLKSCGCKKPDIPIKHGMSKSSEYSIYQGMKNRCKNTNDKKYYLYGGRGIKVCDRWLESFENFFEDMGFKPNSCTLDRKNTNLGYSKENCKWATIFEQNNNKRNNVFVLCPDLEYRTLANAERYYNLKYGSIGNFKRAQTSASAALNKILKQNKYGQ